MATLLIVYSMLILVLAGYSNWITVNESKMSRADYAMAAGYDSINDKIWLLGGANYGYQLLSYEANGSFTDHGQSVLLRDTFGWSQYYTTIAGSLWMTDPYGAPHLNRFFFETGVFV
eukprot:274801_1